jgi:seryl-tRNA synthetase
VTGLGARPLIRDGHVSLYEEDAAELRDLDETMVGSFPLPCVKWEVPSLISEATMGRCGYTSAFPAQLTIAGTIRSNGLARLASHSTIDREDVEYRGMLLTPAACLNIYPMLAHYGFGESLAVTARATVYRHEERFDGAIRLWEFPVREFVLVGAGAFVVQGLEDAMKAAADMARTLGLRTKSRAASDHFYPSTENEVRQAMQVGLAMKQELVMDTGSHELALASFNFHSGHFSEAFGFDRGRTVVTGCAGFGLHRWRFAISERSNP